MRHKLTARKIASLHKRGRYGDGGGLWLQVSMWGTKAWIYQYISPTQPPRNYINKKTGERYEVPPLRQIGLGSAIDTSLAEARDEADKLRKLVKAGIDPLDARDYERQTKKVAHANQLSFKQCAEDYIAAHRSDWRNDKHAAQWSATLATYAFPTMGNVAVAAITTDLILEVLKPIWTTKPETARRVRGRIEAVLDYATVLNARNGDNPARWQGHLKHLLSGKKTVKHHAALPYSEVAKYIAALRARRGVAAKALEFAILTAARTGEVIVFSRVPFSYSRIL